MFSSVNPFGGLSAANILTLFSTLSKSTSRASLGQSVRSSASDATTSSAEAIKEIVAQASASDPAKAIKTILAQAQVDQAQNATPDDGERTQAEIDKEAHDDEYGIGVETFSFAEATNLSTLQANLSAQPATTDAQPETAPASSTDGAVSLAGTGALFSSLHAVSQAYNIGRADAASLAVIAPNDVASITDGNETEAAMTYRQESALQAYQFQSRIVQQEEASYSAADAASNTPTSGAADGSSAPPDDSETDQSYLRLTITAINESLISTAINQDIGAQAQQLVAAFQNGTLGSMTSDGSGFSFTDNFGTAVGVSIVGTVVSSSDHFQVPLGTSDSDDLSAFQGLVNQSSEYFESYFGSDALGEGAGFLIPIGNS